MADNYLEKQYEQYEAKKAAWEKAKKLGKKTTSTPQHSHTEKAEQALESNSAKESNQLSKK